MRIAELAERTGVSASALRYYEARGLLRADARTLAGYRLYRLPAVGRVGFIQRAKALGMSLREIEALLREAAEPPAQARIRHAVAHKLAQTQARIAELEALRSELLLMERRLNGGNPGCGHIGDCECWLPNDTEVAMAIQNVEGCSCCGCTCPSTDGECGCCGCSTRS